MKASLQQGKILAYLKEALIRLVLKKAPLNPSLVDNSQPVSNIPFLVKVLECMVVSQLQSFLDEAGYLQ